MIYINQLGANELARGETFDEAFLAAKNIFSDLTEESITEYSPKYHIDGRIIWTDEPMPGYNIEYDPLDGY